MDVSIIIPTYNRLWCLPQAIESCRGTQCNTEIIVIDDGSTDGTWEWLQDQQGISIYRQDNWGKCWAVNFAFSKAQGKYVRFLDSDDCLVREAIDEQFSLAEKYEADIVVSGHKVFNNEGIDNIIDWVNCDDFIAQQLGECDSSHYSAYLFKKSFLNDIPHRPDFAFRDDRLLVLEAALKNPKVAVHNGHSLMHRKHENDRLQFNSGLQQAVQNYQHFQAYKKILNKLKKENILTERRLKAGIKTLSVLAHWVAKHNVNDAVKIIEYIQYLNPDFNIESIDPSWGKLYKSWGFKKSARILYLFRLLRHGIQ